MVIRAMPDITMCRNKSCPSRLKCYRFVAVPNDRRQSYAGFKPEDGENKCEHFTLAVEVEREKYFLTQEA